jgi:hypothetical protein
MEVSRHPKRGTVVVKVRYMYENTLVSAFSLQATSARDLLASRHDEDTWDDRWGIDPSDLDLKSCGPQVKVLAMITVAGTYEISHMHAATLISTCISSLVPRLHSVVEEECINKLLEWAESGSARELSILWWVTGQIHVSAMDFEEDGTFAEKYSKLVHAIRSAVIMILKE